MLRHIDRVLIDRARIASRVKELGERIAADLSNDLTRSGHSGEAGQIVLIPIMTGAIVFAADLIRQMPLKLSLGLVAVSSYPGKSMMSRGAMIASELPRDLAGKHVLIIDDILDSGQTLKLMRDLVLDQEPASVRTCVLLRKIRPDLPARPSADYFGFDIPDEFVVGYGLDYDGFYRNHPEIVTLHREAL